MKFSVKLLLANMGFVVPRFSEQKSSFLEVLYRSSCSLINAVMKYLNFHTSTSKLGSKYVRVFKVFLCVFSKIFCVFKVIYVCSKINCKFNGVRFFEVSLVFVGELEIRTSHLEVFCKLVFLTFF